MTLPRGNEFQLELINDRSTGISLTGGNNTFPAPVALFHSGLADWWPANSGDAYQLEVAVSDISSSTLSKDALLRLYYEKDLASVDTGADTIAFTDPHGLETADGAGQWTTTGGVPGGLAVLTDYWVIRVDDYTIKMATSEANARAGTAINLTSAGTGTNTFTCLKIADIAVSAALTGAAAMGRTYQFPLWVPRLTKITGSLSVNNATPGTGIVKLNLACKPTKPWGLFVCTFVRTFGATPASSNGTAITPGNSAKSAYLSLGVAAEDLRAFAVGVCMSSGAMANHHQFVDLAVGPGAASRQIVFDNVIKTNSTEGIENRMMTRWGLCSNTETVYVRMQNTGAPTAGFSVIAYGLGGRRIEAGIAACTVAGTVTIAGSPAANGKTVEIYAVDSDGLVENVATTTTAGGAGGFTVDVPEAVRTYFASYVDGADVGRSVNGTPGSSTFDITIGAGGGGETVPPVQTVVSPAAGTSFAADYLNAKDVPAIVDVIDASSAIAFVAVYVKFSDRTHRELVYAGTGSAGFVSPYISYSTITGTGAAGVGFRLSIRRDDGWPKPTSGSPIAAEFTYKAVDAAGNVLS